MTSLASRSRDIFLSFLHFHFILWVVFEKGLLHWSGSIAVAEKWSCFGGSQNGQENE